MESSWTVTGVRVEFDFQAECKRPVTPSGVSTALAQCSLIFRNAVRSQEIPDAFLEKGPATAFSQ